MRLTILAFAMLPFPVLAAGTEDPEPPKPTETTEVCPDGQVWDLATKACMSPEDSSNDDSARLRDVRELAYAGRYQVAFDVLRGVENQSNPMALTYYGFLHRKTGQADLAMRYYDAALQADPDNLLARSYQGQGHVAAGDMARAQAQLVEIRMRGGRGTWAEASLVKAIATGVGSSY